MNCLFCPSTTSQTQIANRIPLMTMFFTMVLRLFPVFTFLLSVWVISERGLAQQVNTVDEHCEELVEYLNHLRQNNSIDDLVSDSRDEVALHFFWKRLVADIRAENGKASEKPEFAVALSKEHNAQFIGFLEGRLRVRVPPRFASRLRSCKVGSEKVVVGSTLQLMPPLLESRETPFGETSILSPYTLSVDGNLILGDAGEPHLAITPDEFKTRLKAVDDGATRCVTVQSLSEKHFIAILSDSVREHPYELVCFDASTGETKWKSVVFSGTCVIRGSSGTSEDWHHQFELVANEDRLFVFGILPFSMYIEAFEMDSGKNLFRFSTSY